jgi:hypothetical protein
MNEETEKKRKNEENNETKEIKKKKKKFEYKKHAILISYNGSKYLGIQM